METTESFEASLDPEHPSLKDYFPGKSIASAPIPLRHAINYAERTFARKRLSDSSIGRGRDLANELVAAWVDRDARLLERYCHVRIQLVQFL